MNDDLNRMLSVAVNCVAWKSLLTNCRVVLLNVAATESSFAWQENWKLRGKGENEWEITKNYETFVDFCIFKIEEKWQKF